MLLSAKVDVNEKGQVYIINNGSIIIIIMNNGRINIININNNLCKFMKNKNSFI